MFTAVPAHPKAPPPPPSSGVETGFVSRLRSEMQQRRGRLVAVCLATVLGPAVVAHAASLGAQTVAEVRPAGGASPAPPPPAPVPGDAATWVPVAKQAAATCPGLSSAVLVAIAHVESRFGLLAGPSSAGAIGPMQFLPATWAAYGTDGDGDGVVDVMNSVDAVHGAARLLCANGGADPYQLPSALWNYNHSDEYVRQVISLARFIRVEDA